MVFTQMGETFLSGFSQMYLKPTFKKPNEGVIVFNDTPFFYQYKGVSNLGTPNTNIVWVSLANFGKPKGCNL